MKNHYRKYIPGRFGIIAQSIEEIMASFSKCKTKPVQSGIDIDFVGDSERRVFSDVPKVIYR